MAEVLVVLSTDSLTQIQVGVMLNYELDDCTKCIRSLLDFAK